MLYFQSCFMFIQLFFKTTPRKQLKYVFRKDLVFKTNFQKNCFFFQKIVKSVFKYEK